MVFLLYLLCLGFLQANGLYLSDTKIRNRLQSSGESDAIAGHVTKKQNLESPLNVSVQNKGNQASAESGDAISGSSMLLNHVNADVYVADMLAFLNQAYSRSGDDVVSGNRVVVGTQANEDITFEGTAVRNSAKSLNDSQAISGNQLAVKTSLGGSVTTDAVSYQNDVESAHGTSAISGTQTNLGGVFLTDVVVKDDSTRNTATSFNTRNQSSIVSGVQTNVKNQAMANFTGERTASHNQASGESGVLVSGIQTNMMNIVSGDLKLNDNSQHNQVQTGSGAVAVAGLQFNGLFNTANTYLNNTARDNKVIGIGNEEKSSVAGVQVNQKEMASAIFNSTSTSRDNEVNIEQGLAVAGVQNNFQDVGDFKDGDYHVLNLDSTALDNKASSSDNAIAGVQNNMRSIALGDVRIKSSATDNNASSTQGTAVGGVQNNFRYVADSNIDIQNSATDNTASASGLGQTAVAGVQNNILKMTNSSINIQNEARYNNAYSLQGNAIGGAQTNVGTLLNGSSITVENNVERNSAITNGNYDAIVESATNVGYISSDSSVFVYEQKS
eukprot:TRINITY_DN3619_c0_g1_i2.p1 TRINITY_DN3619_c0_g1~~TRINITY_DN3619_c0_g1_i2.p1  ORF type:complete len:556 (-),score=65.26 TRINITY_DN3619_c0_g1_i2:588-2255(-)